MSGRRQTPTYVKVAATTSIVGSALSVIGWITYFVAFITSVALLSPFSSGENVALGIFAALCPFALIVYSRYSLIMAGCIVDSISMIPRTVIFAAFAVCQLAITITVLVELGENVPWHLNLKGGSHSLQKEMMPYWVCMLVGSLWMFMCSTMSVCFAALTAILSEHHRRRGQYLVIQ